MDIGALQVTLRRFAAELLQVADQTAISLHAGPGAKTHVLVDWENVQPDEDECRALVPEATDVWLFHGPNQKNVGQRYGSFGDRATEVRIAKTGKNALDFHLSFYMGYIASKHPDARFVVLSNDKGYGPMLDHARELGFVASQSGFGKVKVGRAAKTGRAAKKVVALVLTPAKKRPSRQAAGKKAAGAKQAPAPTPAKKTAARKAAAIDAAAPPRKAAARKAVGARPAAAAPARGRAPASTKSYEQVLALLEKSAPASRPRKLARLLAYVAQRLGASVDSGDAEGMLARLVAEEKVAVDDKWTVSYRL